ncbi:MAG: multicopper oxidase domain-containing protein [Rhodanobacter sp.]
MPQSRLHRSTARTWPAVAGAALRVAFGVVWAVGAALTWAPDFAVHYVGYLHNAAQGQPEWLAGWFAMWIGLVTPHAVLFTWLTRIIETTIALALLTGFARKTLYIAGALFSLLVWSTAEGFGGPYTVGANNMGTAISYVLIFVALIAINSRGRSPYSLDFFIEKRWPWWRHVAEFGSRETLAPEPQRLPWSVQIPAMLGVVVLVVLLIGGLHSSLNVKSASPAAAAAAVSPLMLASGTPIAAPRDARLPPLIGTGDSVDVHLVSSDEKVAIASGVDYQAWTFGGTVPGPIIHVRQGQTVNVTYTNHGTMQHSIDFHAAMTPPSLHYVEIQPGQTIKFSFVARVPGAFLYHCGTPPVLLHIANGMYGALIVDPATPLPPAAQSYVIVQSEWYTQQVADRLMGGNYEEMLHGRPDEVVFNGAAFQYRDHPLTATANERVRLYVINAGPNVTSSFHVIGGIFDKVYPSGDTTQALSGVSTYSIGPGAGTVFDVVLAEPGDYPFVDHDMSHAMVGAIGVLQVPGDAGAPVKPDISEATPTAPAVDMVAASAALGPYQFDAAKGAALYTANCAACHQATGQGVPGAFPSLKRNIAVLDPNPAKHIDVVLNGLHGQDVGGTVYATVMPPFGTLLNDAQVADIVNHERTSWDNKGKPITSSEVQAERARGAAAAPVKP